MAADIIQLNEYKSTIRSDRNGVAFPTIYRARGHYYNDDFTASEKKGHFFYTLSKDDDGGYLDVEYEPIRGFSEEDTGWLILRHHPNRDIVNGYLDALGDLHFEGLTEGGRFFQTRKGLFSLVHRPANPNCPDKFVVYITRAPDPYINHPVGRKLSTGWLDHYQIILLDGSLTENPDIMFPPETELDE